VSTTVGLRNLDEGHNFNEPGITPPAGYNQ
jgi:hypothetical protein